MRSTKLPSWIEHLLGAAPIPAPPHVFALDGARLRYGQFVRDRQGFRCRVLRTVAMPRDAFLSGLLGGPLRDPAAFQGIVGGLVKTIPGGVKDASLVIPDAWLRVAFTESGELPRAADQRDEVLRWKLRRLVPFRVDELRVSAAEVPPLPDQEEPRRLLLGFAIEQLLAQIEDGFAAHGVHLGQISNASLSMLAALAPLEKTQADELTALAVVDEHGYSLVFVRGGSPILHRYKAVAAGSTGLVTRDLKLTRNFLDEHLPGVPLARVLLAAPPEQEPVWVDLLADGLGEPAAALDGRHLPPLRAEEGSVPAWRELAPLLGAARQEVA
ncbi:MAG TPA: hypothetical protein VH988_29895 [Thermoanaerobaculia bacterium]|nr:hypothetical protein [Thermoanaerobaculia bacterium]